MMNNIMKAGEESGKKLTRKERRKMVNWDLKAHVIEKDSIEDILTHPNMGCGREPAGTTMWEYDPVDE